MALITVPSLTKGSVATITLSKSELFTLTGVTASAYFSTQANVKKAVFVYKSNPGNQQKILAFDLSQTTPSAELLVSATGRESFELVRIVLEDNDSGSLTLERAALPAGLDLTIGGGGQQGGGQQGGGQQGGGQQGGGGAPTPTLLSSGLALRLEGDSGLTIDMGSPFNTTWTDQVSGRQFALGAPSNFGGGNFPQYSAAPNFFGTLPGIRLQYGYKMQEMPSGSFLFGSLTNATILMVANSTVGDFLDVSQGGTNGLTISNNSFSPNGSLPQNSIYGLFASGGFGGPPQYSTTNTAPYTQGTSKVIALTLPFLSSSGKLFLNGTEALTGAQGMGGVIGGGSQMSIGGYYQPTMQDSTFGALLVYDRVLSDAEIASMTAYLTSRYSIV